MGKLLTSITMVLGVVTLMVSPSMGQSLEVIVDSTTVPAGGTITGSMIVDGIDGYRGHAARLQISPADAVASAEVTEGAFSGSGGDTGRNVGGVFFIQSLPPVQASPPFTDITTFPATLFEFSITLAAEATGDVTLNIIENGEDGIPAQIARSLSVQASDGDPNSQTIPLDIVSDDFPGGITNAVVTIGGAEPTDTPIPDTPTPTPTESEAPTATPTPTMTEIQEPQDGFVITDAFGGLHSTGIAPDVVGNELYYPGFDIVKDSDVLPDRSGLAVLDGYGAAQVFAFENETPSVDMSILPPWTPGTDQYVAVESKSDSMGFWVLNDVGQIFAVGSALAQGATQSLQAALDPALPAFEPGVDVPGPGLPSGIDFAVVNDGEGVIVIDRHGGTYIVGDASSIGVTGETPMPFFGWDIARAIEIEPNGDGYMVLDGFGAIHPVADARDNYDGRFLPEHDFYFGWDVAKSLAYTPDGNGLVVLDAFGGSHFMGNINGVREVYFGFDVARDVEFVNEFGADE